MSVLRSDIFGMPLAIRQADALRAKNVIEDVWGKQFGTGPGPFDEDLDLLADWFHPKLRGQTLRDALDGLKETSSSSGIPDQIILPCGGGTHLVTPEGRTWLECLSDAKTSSGGIYVFRSDEIEPRERALLDLYRRWSRHRIEDVIQKRTGRAAPLLPPAVGIILLLLVNRSLSPDTAIRRVRDPHRQERIDEVVADVLEAFSDQLKTTKRGRNRKHFSLWSGYPLTEARRRLGNQLVLDRDEGLVFIDRDSEMAVTDFVADDLARRRDVDRDDIERAFDALVASYRSRLDDLSALGSGFERIGSTAALKSRLSDSQSY